MALHGQYELVRIHAGAVVGDLDPRQAALLQADGDAGGPGVYRILHQLLDRGGWALDHLARSDAVDQPLGQAPDGVHRKRRMREESARHGSIY